MGRKAKTKRALKRKMEKRAKKAAEKARYESYKAAGSNQKSKRQRITAKKKAKKVSTISHPNGRCGNAGCTKCHPINFASYFFSNESTKLCLPHWAYVQWLNQKQKTAA